MKTLIHPLFWVFIFLFLFHQLFQNLGLSNAFFRNYFDDLLFIPLFLFGFRFLISAYVPGKSEYRIPPTVIVISVLLFSFVLEVPNPVLHVSNHADLKDIIAYALGGIFYANFVHD